MMRNWSRRKTEKELTSCRNLHIVEGLGDYIHLTLFFFIIIIKSLCNLNSLSLLYRGKYKQESNGKEVLGLKL